MKVIKNVGNNVERMRTIIKLWFTDCLEPLQLVAMDDCRFTASSAIDDASVAAGVKSSGTGEHTVRSEGK